MKYLLLLLLLTFGCSSSPPASLGQTRVINGTITHKVSDMQFFVQPDGGGAPILVQFRNPSPTPLHEGQHTSVRGTIKSLELGIMLTNARLE